MLARPALLNCSVFKADGGLLPLKEVRRARSPGGGATARHVRDTDTCDPVGA